MTKKRSITAGLLVMVLLLLFSASMAAAAISVDVNGNPLTFNVPPVKVGDRVMVPLRGIFEALGATVNWDGATRTITANREATNVLLVIGKSPATVNGQAVALDTPAMIIKGATMVPLRFVSEALGAEVKWSGATQTVSILTDKKYAVTSPIVVPAGAVIPVSLDKAISSADSNKGDKISATINCTNEGDAEFPKGTHLTGTVAAVQRKTATQPGVLDLLFDTALLPDGRTVPLKGTLVALDENSVVKTDGRLIAKDTSTTDRLKFVAIGAGAGLLLSKLTDKNAVTGGLLGAAAGYLYGELNKDKLAAGKDVTVAAGTQFGVKLVSTLTYNASQAYASARDKYLLAAAAKK